MFNVRNSANETEEESKAQQAFLIQPNRLILSNPFQNESSLHVSIQHQNQELINE